MVLMILMIMMSLRSCHCNTNDHDTSERHSFQPLPGNPLHRAEHLLAGHLDTGDDCTAPAKKSNIILKYSPASSGNKIKMAGPADPKAASQ